MVEYRMMHEGSVLTSCLHSGPISLAEVARAEELPSWLERDAQLPGGTVARVLNALCREYGSCGVMAVDGDVVVGKVRFAPAGLNEGVPECAQQHAEAWLGCDPGTLPPRRGLRPRALRIWCVQVVADDRYRRKGIATAMVAQMAAWARAEGWEEIHAHAIRAIPPLLDWAGIFSLDAYRRLGFTPTSSEVGPGLLEGVRHMREGGHGEDVHKQWDAFAHLTDEEAATLYAVTLPLRRPPSGG